MLQATAVILATWFEMPLEQFTAMLAEPSCPRSGLAKQDRFVSLPPHRIAAPPVRRSHSHPPPTLCRGDRAVHAHSDAVPDADPPAAVPRVRLVCVCVWGLPGLHRAPRGR